MICRLLVIFPSMVYTVALVLVGKELEDKSSTFRTFSFAFGLCGSGEVT